jgi:hypothetical protein
MLPLYMTPERARVIQEIMREVSVLLEVKPVVLCRPVT